MKKFLQGRSIAFWAIVIFVFLLVVHFAGVTFWDRSYMSLIQSLGSFGSVYLSIMTLLAILVLIASPFLLLFSPLFIWFIIKKKRAAQKGIKDDTFGFVLWLILVIGVISAFIIFYLASGFLSPW